MLIHIYICTVNIIYIYICKLPAILSHWLICFLPEPTQNNITPTVQRVGGRIRMLPQVALHLWRVRDSNLLWSLRIAAEFCSTYDTSDWWSPIRLYQGSGPLRMIRNGAGIQFNNPQGSASTSNKFSKQNVPYRLSIQQSTVHIRYGCHVVFSVYVDHRHTWNMFFFLMQCTQTEISSHVCSALRRLHTGSQWTLVLGVRTVEVRRWKLKKWWRVNSASFPNDMVRYWCEGLESGHNYILYLPSWMKHTLGEVSHKKQLHCCQLRLSKYLPNPLPWWSNYNTSQYFSEAGP